MALQTTAPDSVDDLAAGRIRRPSKMDQPAVLCSASIHISSHLSATVPLLFTLVSCRFAVPPLRFHVLQCLLTLPRFAVPLETFTLYSAPSRSRSLQDPPRPCALQCLVYLLIDVIVAESISHAVIDHSHGLWNWCSQAAVWTTSSIVSAKVATEHPRTPLVSRHSCEINR